MHVSEPRNDQTVFASLIMLIEVGLLLLGITALGI
jgi:hypothetical protein